MKKVTIKDVAKAAGVSVSAVSMVMNDYPEIGKKTREKVLRVIADMHYTPNIAARSLSSKRKRTIALVLNEINITRGVAMPLEILSGVMETLDETNYEFVFYATNLKKQKEKPLWHFIDENNLAGIIIQGLKVSDPYYQELEESDLPIVAIDLAIENPQIGSVSVDNESAAYEMTKRLIDAGHPNVYFLNGVKDAAVSIGREAGYRRAVKEASKEAHVAYADFSEEKAYDWASKFDKFDKFDAVFAASDLMAIGVTKALKDRKLKNKLAIAGFDDITLAGYVTPSLTTVRQDMHQMAILATRNLIQAIGDGTVKHSFEPYEIVVRESAEI